MGYNVVATSAIIGLALAAPAADLMRILKLMLAVFLVMFKVVTPVALNVEVAVMQLDL
jgi:hypothetical protein